MKDLTFGILTDPHLGPDTRYRGALRKVGSATLELTARFVEAMNVWSPDFVILLGDVVEDVSRETDIDHYSQVLDILADLECPFYPVAGNHDLINMRPDDLLKLWSRLPHLRASGIPAERRLYYTFEHTFDRGRASFVVLQSTEVRNSHIYVDDEQLLWLEGVLDDLSGPIFVLVHHSLADQDTRGNLWFNKHPHIALIRDRARIRGVLERSGKVAAVINGHLHWNEVTTHGGIPYVTVQSLTENTTSVEPPQPCTAWAEVRVDPTSMEVVVRGTDAAHHHLSLGRLGSP